MAKVISTLQEAHAGLQPSILHLQSPRQLSLERNTPSSSEELLRPNGYEKSNRKSRQMSRSLTVPGIGLNFGGVIQGRAQSPLTPRPRSSLSGRKSWPRSPSPHQQLNSVEVEYKLIAAIDKKFPQVKQAFQTVDVLGLSRIPLQDFRRVIETFCFPLTDSQFQHLSTKIHKAPDGGVDYKRFLDDVRPSSVHADLPKWVTGHYRRPETKEGNYEEVESRLRIKVTSQLGNFLKALRLFDYNRDGNIQRHELRRILENFGFRMTDVFFERLWRKCGISPNSGTVNYFEFLRRLGIDVIKRDSAIPQEAIGSQSPTPSQSKKAKTKVEDMHGLGISQIEKRFRQGMIDNYEDIKRAFVAFDKRQDGFVTLEQLKRVLINFLFPVSDLLFAELMARCGVKATHKIAYNQFLEKFQHQGPEGNGQTIPIKPSHKVNPIREVESDLPLDNIWRLLKSHVADNYSSIKQAFLAFDDDKDGVIKRKDLRKVLETFCFRISPQQMKEMMVRLDPQNKGFVSFHEFLNHFEDREGKDAHPWLKGERKQKASKHPSVMAWTMVEDVLREKLTDNWKTIAKAFTKIDDDRDGTISRSELKKLMDLYTLPISDEHFNFLWDRCDENHNEKIEFSEFLRKLGVNMHGADLTGFSTKITDESEAKMSLMKNDQLQRLEQNSKIANDRTSQMTADQVFALLKEHIGQKSADLRKTFLHFDSDGDGKLSKKEFRMVLGNLGMSLTDEHFNQLATRLHFYRGYLSYSDFLSAFQIPGAPNAKASSLHFSNHRYNKIIERRDTMTAEEVEHILRKKITEGFQDLRQAFSKVDEDHDGIVSMTEFRRLLTNFMIPINDRQFSDLVQRLGLAANTPINYRKFLEEFQLKEDVEKGHPWLFTENKFGVTKEMEYLTAHQASQLLKAKAFDQWHDISTAYRRFDRDGNGIVTRKELKAILHRFNIPVTKEEFKKLWNMYDTDKNNCIDHGEFLAKLGIEFAPGDVKGLSAAITKGSEDEIFRHHQNQKAKQQRATENQANVGAIMSAMQVENRLRDLFRDGFSGFRKAFERIDTNKDGFISRSELLNILYSYHIFMKDAELKSLLTRIGLGNEDRLPYERFLAAFEDPRFSGNTKISLDAPTGGPPSVIFESAEALNTEEAIKLIRDKVASSAESIRQAFSAFDVTGSGRINVEDLHQIINSFCCQITRKQFKALLEKITVFMDGTVNYGNFIQSFQKSDTEANRTWLESMLKRERQDPNKGTQGIRDQDNDEKLEKSLGEIVRANYPILEQTFLENDPRDTGKVSSQILQQVLKDCGVSYTDGRLSQLLQKMNFKDDTDKVSFRRFLKHFMPPASPRMDTSRTPSPVHTNKDQAFSVGRKSPIESSERIERLSLSPPETATDVERRIQSKISRQWQKLTSAFKRQDLEQSGLVNKDIFRAILLDHNIMISNPELDLLWKKHDVDQSGRIQYGPFLKKFVFTGKSIDEGLPMQRKSKTPGHLAQVDAKDDVLQGILGRIRNDVVENWKGMRRAFRLEDKRGEGTCTISMFGQMLRKFKIEVSDEDLYYLASFFDRNLSGKVSYNEFLRSFFTQ